MKIDVPVISTTDVLVVGGSIKAVKLALDLKASGLSVFIATPYSYLGDDLCATLDLQSPKPEEFKELFGTDATLTPGEIKRGLNKALIDAGVEFLFQLRPVRPAISKDGKVCGALFASRAGFHAAAAKVVIDATARHEFARSAGLLQESFKPGVHKMRMFLIGGVNAAAKSISAQKLPAEFSGSNKSFPVFEVKADVEVESASPIDIARAENSFRIAACGTDTVCVPDRIICNYGDTSNAKFTPSLTAPVFLAEAAPSGEVAALAASLPSPAPVGFGEKAAKYDFDVVRKDKYFRFADCKAIPFELDSIPVIAECDVFVAGGGTGGAPAAISAARAGMRTICAEKQSMLGGVMTTGRIGKYWYGNRVGFTSEAFNGMAEKEPGSGLSIERGLINVIWQSQWFLEQATAAGADILFDTMTVAALTDGNTVRGAVVAGPGGIGAIRAKFVVDSTGNADFAAAAGADTAADLKDEPAIQGAGLSPVELGNSYTNTDFTFVMDGDIPDATRAYVSAQAKYTNGFDIVPILNTRERRRIIGDIVLQPHDFFANRTYADTITRAMSNFDTHGYIIHPMFMVKPTAHDPRYANVPLRALLPKGFEGMAVTGLGVSAHRDCMPLIRMQPDVMNQGYAAALAAAMAIESGKSVRDIDVRALQRKLIDKGILNETVLSEDEAEFTWIENDEYTEISRIFMSPEKSAVSLKAEFAANPTDTETAATLAFLGENDGADLLVKTISGSKWDEGWNYRGMGQFGLCVSKLDTMIIALSNIGGDSKTILGKLAELEYSMAFSHIRAVCLALMRNPEAEAAPFLEKLLASPEARGYAVLDLEDALASNRPDYNDNSFRNSQLKEIYLAKALAACDPESNTAREIISEYARGMNGIFSIFAAAKHN